MMVDKPVAFTLGFLILSLTLGSVVRFLALRNASQELRTKRLASLRTWWILTLCVTIAVLLGRWGVIFLMGTASLLAIREFNQLLRIQSTDVRPSCMIYLFLAITFLMAGLDASPAAWAFLPLGWLAVLTASQLLQGTSHDYVRRTASLYWGSMVLVMGLAYAARLMVLSSVPGSPTGPAGWFLFLVILTETNDIAQALVGRKLGAHKRHRISPEISPNKTWEGFLGGVGTTLILSILLAPSLTPLATIPLAIGSEPYVFPWLWPLIAGLLISVSGYFGDINMSALKRDVGVKDSSNLLPGMGGMIDRVDSISLAGPMFYGFASWLVQ